MHNLSSFTPSSIPVLLLSLPLPTFEMSDFESALKCPVPEWYGHEGEGDGWKVHAYDSLWELMIDVWSTGQKCFYSVICTDCPTEKDKRDRPSDISIYPPIRPSVHPFPLLEFSPALESCSGIYAGATSCLIVSLLFNVLFLWYFPLFYLPSLYSL